MVNWFGKSTSKTSEENVQSPNMLELEPKEEQFAVTRINDFIAEQPQSMYLIDG